MPEDHGLHAVVINPRSVQRSKDHVAGKPSDDASAFKKFDGRTLTDTAGDNWEVTTRRKTYFDSEDNFVVTFIGLFKLMYQKRLMGEVRLMTDWLCGSITEGNLVSGFSQKRVHEETGISRCNVSGIMSKLEEHEIAFRGGTGEIWLNPRLVFMGKPSKQRSACEKWDELVVAKHQEKAAISAVRSVVG